MRKVFVDRSRVEDTLRCKRLRYLRYHQDSTGIDGITKPLPLAVGGSVHVGLALLLREGQRLYDESSGKLYWSHVLEDNAVAAALADFSQHSSALELDTTEQSQMQPIAGATTAEQLAESLGLSAAEAGIDSLAQRVGHAQEQFNSYLVAEQSALVEAMVRAYSRRRLRPLLEQFEVLEVEREGTWLLSEWMQPNGSGPEFGGWNTKTGAQLWFMSRPDALLRERSSNQLYLQSFKTAASWDIRKARDAEHDMQGLSEGVEIERRLGEWWEHLQWCKREKQPFTFTISREFEQRPSETIAKFLLALPAPPRIHAIRYEYMLKGDRWRDKELSARLQLDCRSQRSHLVRCYEAVSVPARSQAFSVGDVCWSWDYTRVEDMRESSLAWQNWKSRPVWERPGGIKAWIDRLDSAAPLMSGEDSTVGMEPRALGYQCDAQALGVTAVHPLDAVFIPPVVVYRNDDDLRDWMESTEWQEREVAEHIAEVEAAADEGERRSLLNRYFSMNRHACIYPSQCQFVGVCYGGADIRRDPLASGLFVKRTPNHP
jgi:hypothetical protein